MQIITGRICKLLHNSAGDVHGFSLDTGIDVRFPADRATRVLAVVTAGSPVEIHARMRGSLTGDAYVDASFLTNLDSRQSIDLHALPTPHSPEVSTDICAAPRRPTPLAPAFETVCGPQPLATANDVASEIEQAYDGLHRTQAMLAYLKMMNQEKSSVGQYLDEAQHTYVQALSRYEAQDFEGAREFAAASSSLARVVEILVSRTFHSSANYPKLVPPPPEHVPARSDVDAVHQDLDRIEHLLARIYWVVENGILPSEDLIQVQKLSSWSERLYRRARHLVHAGAMEDAIELSHAANAAACSAEHLCKKCYVTNSADSLLAAAAR